MPDKRVIHAAERIPLPRKVRERIPVKREREKKVPLNFATVHDNIALADAPAIEERALESD